MRLSLRKPTSPTAGPTARVANVAHRGASAYVAENTLAAIRRAIALGSDLVEVDVQRSQDGVPVLVHDRTLDRTTDVRAKFPSRAPWRVADFTYDELRRLDAGSWKSAACAGERIPTLVEAVETLARSETGLLLELKAPQLYPGIVADVAAALRSVPEYVESAAAARRLIVQSFHFPSAREYKVLEPSVPVGLLGRPARANLPALATWADQVNPGKHALDAAYVAEVHRLGMQSFVWTVNQPFRMRRALSAGVDGIITNRPDVLGELLGAARAELVGAEAATLLS